MYAHLTTTTTEEGTTDKVVKNEQVFLCFKEIFLKSQSRRIKNKAASLICDAYLKYPANYFALEQWNILGHFVECFEDLEQENQVS